MKLIKFLHLLIIFQLGRAAFVQLSVPNSAVELGTDIRIAVNEMSPNVSNQNFDRLDCGIISPDDPRHKIIVAQYDKHSLKFKTPSQGIPKEYRERVSYVGTLSLVVQKIQFEDKFLKVVCILNYKNGSLTRHVESFIYEIKMVYVSPKFHFNSTKEGNVTIKQGHETKIRCVAKSFPQSNISWESRIGTNAYRSTRSHIQQRREFTTTSIFIMDSPRPNYDGKKVDCVVIPVYGKSIRRRFTLSYKSDEKKNDDKDDKIIPAIIGGTVGGIVLLVIIIVVVCICRK